MKEIPAIYCDIDGVVTKKFASPEWDNFGEPNESMLKILNSLGRDFFVVFITGRWAMGQEKVEGVIKSILPDLNCKVFCKHHDFPGTTAEYKILKIKELEKQGYRFNIGFDDHSVVTGFLHNHGMLVARILAD